MIYAPITPTDGAEGTLGGLILYVVIALGVSFLCSVLEAVLLSVTLSHVEVLMDQGSQAGALMQKHKEDVERPISAILTLNTIAHTVGAAGAGAEATAIFGNQYIGIISAVLTLLILVFSEIIPKTLGAVYWKQLTPFAAYTIQFLVFILFPAVWVFEKLTAFLQRNVSETTLTRADFEVLAKIGEREGILQEEENRVLRNLFRLGRIQVKTIMTPRTVITTFQQNLTVKQTLSQDKPLHYARVPIHDGNIDDITGYVLRMHVLQQSSADNHEVTLQELSQKIHAVSEHTLVSIVLNEMIARQEHIFLVVDEFGGTAGIVTLEDAIESLLGLEIIDESDEVTDLRKLAQERYNRQKSKTVLVR